MSLIDWHNGKHTMRPVLCLYHATLALKAGCVTSKDGDLTNDEMARLFESRLMLAQDYKLTEIFIIFLA